MLCEGLESLEKPPFFHHVLKNQVLSPFTGSRHSEECFDINTVKLVVDMWGSRKFASAQLNACSGLFRMKSLERLACSDFNTERVKFSCNCPSQNILANYHQ